MKADQHSVDLINRLAQNDVDAFKEVYQQNYNRLLRYGMLLNKDKQAVADTIQDLFVWIWQNPENVRNIRDLRVYLFKALKRNLIRSLSKRSNLVNDYQHMDSSDMVANIEDQIIKEEADSYGRKWLARQLDALPPKQKEVIYLRYYEGLSYNEIAKVLEKSNQVVRNYTSRALIHLRKSVDTSSNSD